MGVVAATIGALLGGYFAGRLAGVPPSQAALEHDGPLGYQLVRGVTAAVGEEFIVLALPVVLVRYTTPHLLTRRAGVVAVVIGLVILRMAYHLYYEQSALMLVPWAVVTALLYLRIGRVWPLIIAHAAYNTLLAFNDHDLLAHPATLTILGVVAVGALLRVTTTWKAHRGRGRNRARHRAVRAP